LFDGSSADPDLVVLNWIGRPAEKFEMYGEAFHLAGRKLTELYGTTGAMRDVEACPIIYLYRHALELYVKAILVEGDRLLRIRGKEPLDLKHCQREHRLSRLLDDFERVLAELDQDWVEDVKGLSSRDEFLSVIAELEEVDPRTSSFRYPVDKEGRAAPSDSFTFSLGKFCSRMGAILDGLDLIHTGVVETYGGELEVRASEKY
jgi:hypothetical protein